MKFAQRIFRIFYVINFIFLLLVTVIWSTWYVATGGQRLGPLLSNVVIKIASLPSNAINYLFHGYNLSNWLLLDSTTIPLERPDIGESGAARMLISTFGDENNLKLSLIRVKSKKLLKTWEVNVSELDDKLKFLKRQPDASPNCIQHPLMLKDSSVIFINDGLFKVDKNNKLELLNADVKYHHSIESENDSMFWICATKRSVAKPIMQDTTLREDLIVGYNINKKKIIHIKSISNLLTENGYGIIFRGPGIYPEDRFHINDIQPVKIKSKYWDVGDLFISIRNLSVILLYRPSTQKVIWLKQGPWLSQHDVDVVDASTISIFNNDVLQSSQTRLSVKGYNSILFFNFETCTLSSPYDQILKKLKINTIAEGQSELMPNGDLYIDEAGKGKIIIINKDRLKWMYIERVDKTHIKRFNWPRLITN